MLYRIAGKIAGGKTFVTRISGSNAIDALVQGRKALNDAGIGDGDITEIRARGIDGKTAVHIGDERARKPKGQAAPGKKTATAPASGSKK